MPLRLGAFLRRRGVVSAADLAAGLAEQARSRSRLGEVAVRWGWLTQAQAEAVTRHLRPLERFGEAAVRLGFVSSAEQVSRLLWYQRAQQRRLGAWLVEKGLLTAQRLEALLEELSRHNAQVRLRGGWEAQLGLAWARMNQPI